MIIGFLFQVQEINAQSIIEETQQSIQINQNKSQLPEYSLEAGNNIPSSILKFSFWFYKNTISSQDFGNCSFVPSCSEYAVEAISKKGVLRGYAMIFDRLSRCHSLSPDKYKIDVETGLLVDHVD